MSADHAETEVMRWPLRLLLQGLAPRDEAKVRRFLARGRTRLKHAWDIVADGDAEVVLVEGIEVDTVRGMLDPPLVTLHLLHAKLDAASIAWRASRAPQTLLSEPLDFEALMAALEHAERRIGPAAICGSRTPGGLATAPDIATTGCRFKLRTWPPAGLMSDDRENRRLASFLVAEGLDIQTLARLSNVAADRCVDFVARMAGAQLLEIASDGDAPAPRLDTGGPKRGPWQVVRDWWRRI